MTRFPCFNDLFKLLAGMLIFLIASCSSDDVTEAIPVLTDITLRANRTTLDLNNENSAQLEVQGYDQFGNAMTITSSPIFSADRDIISINSKGEIMALEEGEALITAKADNLISTLSIEVIDTSPKSGETYLYVSDAGNFENPPWKIIRYDSDGTNPITFIDDQLNWPQDILFIEEENVVLISNLNSNRINKYNGSNGEYLGVFASGIMGPTRMKVGPDGLLYVLQWSGNGKVLRYELNGAKIDEFTSAGVPNSIGLDWDDDRNLYVSSFEGFIRKFDQDGVDLGMISQSILNGPTNIIFHSNGNLLALDWSNGIVVQLGTDGSFINNFITGLSQPEGITFSENGTIYIGDGGTGSVKEFSNSGSFIKHVVASGAGDLKQPNAVVIRKIP